MPVENPIRIVVEEVDNPGKGAAWKVGYEMDTPGVHESNVGWAADSPEQGLLRVLNDKLRSTRNLASAVTSDLQAINALIVEIEQRQGVDLALPDQRPTYEVTKEWGKTRIEQVEAQRNEWQERLTNGHRCEHGRLCLDHCSMCPGPTSVGGPACSFDDKNFWVHWPDSPR